MSSYKLSQILKEFLIVTLGMLITAVAVYYFLVPSKLVIGTISGLGIVISSALGAIGVHLKVSLVITICNILLLLFALVFIGKEFGLKTIYASVILGPMMDLLEKILPYEKLLEIGATSVMGDVWLDLVCFVILLSIAQALLFNINASTGGLDIVAKLLNKYTHLELGTCVAISGFAVSLTAFAINPFKLVIVGLIGTWINGLVVDYFTASINKKKRVSLVTTEYEKVRKFIIEDLGRGCSLYEQIGGYTGNRNIEIQSLLTLDEFGNLMEFLRREKIDAFVSASNCSEIYGLWLKPRRFHF